MSIRAPAPGRRRCQCASWAWAAAAAAQYLPSAPYCADRSGASGTDGAAGGGERRIHASRVAASPSVSPHGQGRRFRRRLCPIPIPRLTPRGRWQPILHAAAASGSTRRMNRCRRATSPHETASVRRSRRRSSGTASPVRERPAAHPAPAAALFGIPARCEGRGVALPFRIRCTAAIGAARPSRWSGAPAALRKQRGPPPSAPGARARADARAARAVHPPRPRARSDRTARTHAR